MNVMGRGGVEQRSSTAHAHRKTSLALHPLAGALRLFQRQSIKGCGPGHADNLCAWNTYNLLYHCSSFKVCL